MLGESREAASALLPGSLDAHPARTRDGFAALHIALACRCPADGRFPLILSVLVPIDTGVSRLSRRIES
jgi:hypothetical protein